MRAILIASNVLFVAAACSIPPRTERQNFACSFDTAAAQFTDSIVLGLAPASLDLRAGKGSEEVRRILDIIRIYLRPPSAVQLPFWARVKAPRDSASTESVASIGFGLDNFVLLRFDSTGRLASRDLDLTTASPELNLSLLQAILDADSARAFPTPSDSLRRMGGRVALRLVNAAGSDVPFIEVAHVEVRGVRAHQGAEALSPLKPSYPRNASYLSVGDTVQVQFLVSTNGKVVPGSERVLRGRYFEFIEATLRALSRARFLPGRIGACPVPLLTEETVAFVTDRRPPAK